MDVRRSLLGPMVLVMLTLFAAPAAAVTCDGRWAVQPPPPLPNSYEPTQVGGLAVGAGGDLWAAGTARISADTWRGVVAHRHAGRWQVTTLTRPAALQDIATAGGAVWAIGQQRTLGGAPVVVTLRGGAWVPAVVDLTGLALTGIALSSPQDVWVSAYLSNTARPRAVVLHFDGRSWTRTTLGAGYAFGVATTAPGDTWVVGRSGVDGSHGVPASWHGDGRTWRLETVPGFKATEAALLRDVRALPDGTVWASGILNLGNCCNNNPVVAQHLAGGWRDRTGGLDQADGDLTGILVGPRSSRPTVVGGTFVGDSGGGFELALLAERAGTTWRHPAVTGFGQPLRVPNAFLSAAAGAPGSDNVAIGLKDRKPLLISQCTG